MNNFELQKTRKMVEEIEKLFPLSKEVREAIISIPRALFVPIGLKFHAYKLNPLPLSCNQWISSPLTVAKMTEYLVPQAADSVLEIGCGSGYQAAVLSKIIRRVFTIERIKKLTEEARKRFAKLNLINISLRYQDGIYGWKEFAPYDRIIFSAAIEKIPEEIFSQLKDKGVIVAPIQKQKKQIITRITRKGESFEKEEIEECLFVPVLKGVL
jgi:protein-L-isoaspartate(D-aspartate) O-methyltransferase